jgi:hypothetical protein
MADVVRRFGDDVRRGASLTYEERRALDDIERCRTIELGAHRELYECGHEVTAYNSCRNRSCPACLQGKSRDWVEQRELDLLPVPYFHVVFTVPQELADLPGMTHAKLYDALIHAASSTLLQFGRRHLGGEMGFLAVLHTWGQKLTHHPHVHCVVAGGALNSKDNKWKRANPGYLFPVRALSKVFRGTLLAHLRRHGLPGMTTEQLAPVLAAAARHDWIVYAKPPFGGPRQVLRYLARYTHRIAISEHRLLSVDDESVTFAWKDYRDGGATKQMKLPGPIFLRRFLQHVLPRSYTRLRAFGFLANSGKAKKLAAIRALLNVEPPPPIAERLCLCPVCGKGQLTYREMLEPWSLLPRSNTS